MVAAEKAIACCSVCSERLAQVILHCHIAVCAKSVLGRSRWPTTKRAVRRIIILTESLRCVVVQVPLHFSAYWMQTQNILFNYLLLCKLSSKSL